MPKRFKTNYPGIYYRYSKRIGKKGTEKIYYIVFKKDGKVIEEKVGRQFVDDMTPARAASIRGERIEGKRKSRREIKSVQEQERQAQQSRWTIARLWSEYTARHPQLKGLAQDQNRYEKYLVTTFGGKEPKEISSSEVDTFRVHLLKTLKPATVKNTLELLRRICKFGEKKHLCDGIPFIIEMPRVYNEKTEDLTDEQLARLLHTLAEDENQQAADVMRLALCTGMRRGEIFRLRKADIDYEREFVIVRDPKGGEDQKIPLNDLAKEILKRQPETESVYLFPGRDGKQRVDIKRAVNRIKRKAELPEDFRALHGLRHVYASMLASSGQVDLYTLQKLLTHKSPIMTQRYAHLRDEALKQAANVADALLAQTTTAPDDSIKDHDNTGER